MSISIGSLRLRNRVLLAPMAGVTDAPFRAAAWRTGAGLVISEMIASAGLMTKQRAMLERLRRGEAGGTGPFVVQLAGREARWLAEGARLAVDAGARMIDINMGCPAKLVAGKLSGAALLRDPDGAARLVAAVVKAAGAVPVSVKMRLGWDADEITAPEVARLAVAAGARLITVHGRTRRQFYSGRADWRAVAAVVRAAGDVPVVVNGDIDGLRAAEMALAQSGAAALMVGRAAQGRPWFAGELADRLDAGRGIAPLPLSRQVAETGRLLEDMLRHHGVAQGLKRMRKHLGWALTRWREAGHLTAREERDWRARLVRNDDARQVAADLRALGERMCARQMAA